MRSRRMTSSVIQQRSATASSDCAIAMENWSAAPTPKTASSPACSRRADAPTSGDATVTAAWDIRDILQVHDAAGGFEHLLGRDAGQAPEIAGLAAALIAGPAGQPRNFDGFGQACFRTPRGRTGGQRRTIQADDWHMARGGYVHGAAVASYIDRRVVQHGAKLGERELAKVEHVLTLGRRQLRARLRDHLRRRMLLGRS